jgi:hypothetical protein
VYTKEKTAAGKPVDVEAPGENSGHAEFKIVDWRALQKGDSLQGFLAIATPSGLVLHDCTLHERADGRRWVGLPAKQYTKNDGETAWARLVDFIDTRTYFRFQTAALEAVDRYFAENGGGE